MCSTRVSAEAQMDALLLATPVVAVIVAHERCPHVAHLHKGLEQPCAEESVRCGLLVEAVRVLLDTAILRRKHRFPSEQRS